MVCLPELFKATNLRREQKTQLHALRVDGIAVAPDHYGVK